MKLSYIRIFVCFITLFSGVVPLHAQQYQWVTGGGTTAVTSLLDENETVLFMCTDPNGNTYALSRVNYYTVHVDTLSLDTYPQLLNLLISSYNCQGQLRWAKVISSNNVNGSAYAFGLVSDSSGHIYVAGNLVDHDLKIGTDTVVNGDSLKMLGLIQFDSSGHLGWVTHFGLNTVATYDSTFTVNGGLAIDKEGNAHVVVTLRSNVILDTADTTRYGTYDLKVNASSTLLSAKRLLLDSTLLVTDAAIDKESNKLYVIGNRSGYFYDSSYYDFIAAFDTSRNRIWIDTIGGQDGSGGFGEMVTDGQGHIYASAGGNGYVDYKGDTVHYRPGAIGGHMAGVMKLDTAGNMIWFCQFDSHYDFYTEGVTLMPNNKIGVTGGFEINMDAKTITGIIDTFSGDLTASFLSVLDTGGNIISVKNLHGGGGEYFNGGYAVTSDKIGNLYVGGEVEDSLPDTLIPAFHTTGGTTDFYVLKYGVDCNCTSMPVCNYSLTGTSTINTTYTGTTTPSIDSVVWSFGDAPGGISTVGATANGLTASHVYTMVGVANLCAIVYTGCGNDIHCRLIPVNCPTGGISAAFTDTGSTVRGFTYTGTTSTVDSVTWNYGDGHTATGTALVHTYTASGTYTVCATAHSPCGNSTDCHTVVINCVPVSSYTYSGIDPVNFAYTGTTIPGLDSVVWNFGDGHTAEGTTATHTYSASATYNVCATVQTICGNNTHCSNIVVSCTPAAAFTDTGSFVKGFTYTGTSPELDSITWDFGDGSIATGSTALHTYSASGSYNVCVTAYGLCGSNTTCSTISVDCTPVSNFTYTGISTITFTFTGTTVGLDSVFWILGDGSTATGTTVTHAYTYAGLFTPCAQVYTNCGNSSHCEDVAVNCLANASFSYSGSDPISYIYTGSTDGLDSVVWYFGDGSTDTGLSTSHYYSDSNSYNVCVVEYSDCGVDSGCNSVVVSTEGVPMVSNANIQVFPNPTGNLLNITGLNEDDTYRLLSVTGVCVQQGILHSSINTIMIGNTTHGIYILEIKDLSGRKVNIRVVKE